MSKNIKKVRKWKGQLMLLLVFCILTFTGCGSFDNAVDEWAKQQALGALETISASSTEISGNYETKPTSESETASEPEPAWESETVSESEPALESEPNEGSVESFSQAVIDENGSYTSKDDVSLYLHTYGELPDNFITKGEAQALGWEGGSLEPYAPGKCIGGDKFGNYEGLLPDGSYYECDIDTLGKKSRGAKRIVYSADGSIYYTEDHYESFELLYSGN